MELLPPPLPLPLSTDDASNLESEQQPLDTSLTLIGIDAPKRCVIHDNRNRKNMVPFLKSNYKYKRRIMDGRENGIPQVNYSLTAVKQVEVERFQYLQRSLSDSYFEVAAFGFIRIMSTVILFRDILWNFVRRIARESRVWCVHRLSRHCLNEMSGEVKSFTSGSSRRWRFGVTAATLKRCSKSFGLRYVNASLKLIYLTLFIALWMTLYEVEAGTCWMDRRDNGKCETVYSKNMTKAQCCGENQLFSYTEKNLSDVEYFFALALGGGTECVPCLESCKDIVCGPNKRCVKRKGHPKCVCSPQCGSGKKHKKAQKRKKNKQQHIHQQNGSLKPPHVIDVGRTKEHVSLVNFHSPITVRDVRSLSSEIHSNPSAVSAMVLTSPGDTISQSNSRRKSQRIPISTDPTKKQVNLPAMQQHRIHHHHHHHDHHHHHHPHQHDDRLSQLESQEQEQEHPQQQQQQEHLQEHHTVMVARRRHANTDRNKGDKLIIIADDLVQPSTERDNDLAESNSLRDGSTTTSAAAGNHHRHHQQKQKQKHHQQQQQQQNGRHHFKKHAKPKRKITDQNGASHNSVHNRTATNMLTQTGTFSTANRNEMKMAERRRHRTQSLDGFSASFASPSSSSSSSSPDHRFRQHKSTPQVYASNSFREQHLGQDYADDLAFDDKIHNGFFSNGFPYPHQELSPDEGRYTHPVCGSDGRTYNTECQLKKRACRTDNSALVVAYRGHCQTSCKKVNCLNGLQCVEDHYAIPHCIVCSIKCPIDDNASQIDPARAVCGVDGNTYKSTCDINRMVCKIGRSIAVAYPGPCREDRTSCDSVSCGPRMTCLTDLVTHRPRCVSCKFKCSRKRRPANIRYEEGKLCGTNNRTYYSWCEMKKDSCQTGFFIDIKSIGECQTEG